MPRGDQTFTRTLALGLALAALIAAGIIFGTSFRKRNPSGSAPSLRIGELQSDNVMAEPSPEPVGASSLLDRMLQRLKGGDSQPGDLERFRRTMLGLPPSEVMAAILKFLASGQDALTGEAFAVTEGGSLKGAPTLRILLLDLLGQLSRRTNSPEGLAASRAILSQKTTADEWAIALRNVGWSELNERAYLTNKVREMIEHAPWKERPSAGFREAFDVIVFVRDPAFIPDLAEMLRGEDAELQSTAAVTLDRLSESAPLEAMTFLNQNPGELGDKPFLRADYFSKADLSQPAQRAAVETYLARPDVTIPEKTKFLGVLASPGSFASDTLLTQPPPDEFPPERIAGLRQTLGDWVQSGRFPELTASLLLLQNRLARQ